MVSPYKVVEHLGRYRITGARGPAALVTYEKKEDAEALANMLFDSYAQGVTDAAMKVREALGSLK